MTSSGIELEVRFLIIANYDLHVVEVQARNKLKEKKIDKIIILEV